MKDKLKEIQQEVFEAIITLSGTNTEVSIQLHKTVKNLENIIKELK